MSGSPAPDHLRAPYPTPQVGRLQTRPFQRPATGARKHSGAVMGLKPMSKMLAITLLSVWVLVFFIVGLAGLAAANGELCAPPAALHPSGALPPPQDPPRTRASPGTRPPHTP